jgi:GT2 family glycosyltransferase
LNYKIDIKRISDGNIHLQGWVLPKKLDCDVSFKVKLENKTDVDFKLTKMLRNDVAEVYLDNYQGDKNFGFDIEFKYNEGKDPTYNLIITDGVETVNEKINKRIIDAFNTADRKKKELILSYLNFNTFKRAINFFFKNGFKEFFKKSKRKLAGFNVDYDYSEWYELTRISDEELESQRKFDGFNIKPFYSIVIPIFDTDEHFLYLLFKSIINQTYQNFEVCVADATDYSKNNNNPKQFFERLKNNYYKDINQYSYDLNKINVKYLSENLSIADNTNEAIKMANGDYIVLCDHDDELTLDALYEVTKKINECPSANLIYSDEDKVDTKDESYFEPAFKSDFNLDMLLSVNYFCHLTTIKKTVLDRLYSIDKAYERKEFNGAQDYDLFLRIVNLIINDTYKNGKYDTSTICHIPKVLYHWRCHKLSTSKNTSSKLYAFENGNKTIEEFYKNSKINFSKIECVKKGFDYGLYHTKYRKDITELLISIIIPNKDHIDDLDLTINSVLKGSYQNVEIIICENNSIEEKTFEYYKNIKDKRIKVVYYKGDFNYSKINNYARQFASGKYILFLNNDVEMISADSLHEMISYVKRDDVGIVGSKLLYSDKSYQHAGVVIGIGGIADHLFKGINDFDNTYMNRAQIVQDLNAVTAACLMIKAEIFDKINGFDEKLKIAFNDIDLCLRVRELGYLVVYNPYSSFYHYESKSRGLEDTPEKVKRFNNEFAFFVKRWNDKLNTIDEYYNPNLTLRQNNFALRNLKFEKIGEPFPIPEEIREIMKTINE